MTHGSRAMSSVYLEWAKLHSGSTYNLATSGIMSYPLSALPVTIQDLEINGRTIYGYDPLLEKLAQRCGVTSDCVVTTNGTSMANHLAMAAMIERGDDVLIESPTYGLLLEVASYLGANIVRFERRFEDGFQIDLDAVRAALTSATRLIVLTNLHNPSGALTDRATLLAIGEMAESVGARVLVDEVYLPMIPEMDFTLGKESAIHLGKQFVVTSSLTKSYGLSGIRCGWILAEPELVKRIWRLNDLFNATPVHPGELLSVIALDHLEEIGARSRDLLRVNRETLDSFLNTRSDLDAVRPVGGTVVFPRLKGGAVEAFCKFLRERFETTVVPGEFFEMPEFFRIGIGGDVAMTAEGLKRMGLALDAFHQE
jgi:aspartate/methionine/tyrosine aminotransferase